MDLNRMTIFQVQDLLSKKKISSVELTNFFLERIKDLDPKLKICLEVFETRARAQAVEADKRRSQGESGDLLGIPYLVKDNILVKGQKATGASKMLENYIAPYNAGVIESLDQAGAVLLGKTNLDELGQGSSTENSVFFPSKNPWDLDRVPGDASAAAVSAGLALFALGSDAGGSVRQPASFTNLSGLKPSYGLISRWGLMSLSSSTDTIGIITKTAQESALILKHLAGTDTRDLNTAKAKKIDYLKNLKTDINGMKIGVIKEFMDQAMDLNIRNGFLEALEVFKGLGAKIVEISLDSFKVVDLLYQIISSAEISSNLARFDGIRYGYSLKHSPKGPSVDNINELYLKNRGESLGAEVKRRILLGAYVLSFGYPQTYYQRALEWKKRMTNEFKQAWSRVDLIMSPSSGVLAPKFKTPFSSSFLTPISLAGLPAISIPAGFADNLPYGLQIIAPSFEESRVLSLATVYQTETKWTENFPNI